MIIIPEIETVVILVPRTGSGSLRRSIAARYPGAMLVYRHMEADGVPIGYDRWRRFGIVRHPVDRLWSLYKFLKNFDGEHDQAYMAAQRASVRLGFSEWIVRNETVFTSPYDSAGRDRFWPHFSVRHPLPENRKSQFLYLRPDLGTRTYRFDERGRLYDAIGLNEDIHVNQTPPSAAPPLSDEADQHVRRIFAWDLMAVGAPT